MRTDAQTRGDDAESAVVAALAEDGWTILARNVRAGRGELDIVAVDPGPPRMLVVVEVRHRGRRDFGLAEESVGHRKRLHLRAAIGRLFEDGLPGGNALPSLPLRVDLVAVEPPERVGDRFRIRHHRGIAL